MFDNCVTGGDGERDEMGMAMAMTMIFSFQPIVPSLPVYGQQGSPGGAAIKAGRK